MPRLRTIACPHCGHLVRKRDVTCEQCGAETPQSQRKTLIGIVGFIVVALAIVWAYFQVTGVAQHLQHP